MDKSIVISNGSKYIELPFDVERCFDSELKVGKNGAYCVHFAEEGAYINDTPITQEKSSVDSLTAQIFVSAPTEYSISGKSVLRIGAEPYCDVVIADAAGELAVGQGVARVLSGTVFINGVCRTEGEYAVSRGDCVYMGAVKVFLGDNTLVCDGAGYETSLLELVRHSDIDEDFPHYKRSPRIIKNEPTDKVEIKDPAAKPEKKKGAILTILMPLAMVCITVALGIVLKRGIMVLMSATMMMATTAFSVVRLIGDSKERKIKAEQRENDYKEYLLHIRKRLNALYQGQRESMTYHYPSVPEIEKMTAEHSGRIYEHASNDGDFLRFSVGYSTAATTYGVKYNSDALKASDDELLQEMREIVKPFTAVPNMPTVVDLKRSHLALVGSKESIHAQLKSIVAQLAFFQSYLDLNIVILLDEESRKDFEWMRWLPHCRLGSINTLTIISSENQRDKVLGNITSQLKERKANRDAQKKDSVFLPHYVFIIDNPKLIMSHSIMEYLQGGDMDLGFGLIFTTHLKANVPENIKTVLMLDSRERGTLLLKEGQYLDQPIRLEPNDTVNYESIARRLCPIIHNKGVTTQIPTMLTFFDMYGIKRPEELPIEKMWSKSACNKSLAVPLGARADKDIVFLNLHEKAHGPHGLVAGTTGSGKSEAIQSYILSLALNFHPHDVGFLLIDYKGGGMAKLFETLPHLLGIITNLDGSESMRALASIKSELARRQRIFNANDVNNINDYTKLFKAGKAEEPLPHLFIISDEFAELKKEQPDFMKELVSTARIGRSLGVHLILATQKPSGVVDDQIWSNSRFKLALKVQNEADSNEVLKTPDAARITQSGRAYLQVGNNEIYELFQTAWSGAPYKDSETVQLYDERIYLENEAGQGELLNSDLSEGQESSSMETQLSVLVKEISRVYTQIDAAPVTRPWLPPLGDMVVTEHIHTDVDVGRIADYHMGVPLGLVDLPENQEQIEFVHDFFKDGNLALFGASGYGKSVSMMNVTLEMASANSPALVQFYIIDLGNASLIQLKGLPHTADYISFDDSEKLDKFITLISGEIAARKRLFAKENAVNFKMYNQTAANKLPAIIVEIDNYDVVKELGTTMEEFVVKLTRDGTGVGIYTMISASRPNAVRYSTLNNFKTKVALYSFDSSDIMAAVGRSSYTLAEVRGRALVKLKEPHVMQCYFPVKAENDLEYAGAIRDAVTAIAEKNTALRAKPIPVLPETVDFSMLEKSKHPRRVALGLDAETVQTDYADLSAPLKLIVGAPQTGKTNMMKLMLRQLVGEKLFIADSRSLELRDFAGQENVVYLDGEAVLAPFKDALQAEVAQRKQQYEQSDRSATPRDFYAALSPAYLFIDDADLFVETVKSAAKEMELLINELAEVGISIVATTAHNKLRGFDNITKRLKEAQSGVVLGTPMEQQFFSVAAERGYKSRIDMGFLVERGSSAKIMIPEA